MGTDQCQSDGLSARRASWWEEVPSFIGESRDTFEGVHELAGFLVKCGYRYAELRMEERRLHLFCDLRVNLEGNRGETVLPHQLDRILLSPPPEKDSDERCIYDILNTFWLQCRGEKVESVVEVTPVV